MALIIDYRWVGPHGIGRFAREVATRSTPITAAHREAAALSGSPQWVEGHYNPWPGITRNVLGGQLYSKVSSSSDQPRIDCAVGAALCIRRDVLEEAGLPKFRSSWTDFWLSRKPRPGISISWVA